MERWIFHAKNVALRAEPKLKLLPEESEFLHNNNPRVYVRYYGRKFGKINFIWPFSSKRALDVSVLGQLDGKDGWGTLEWKMELRSMFIDAENLGDPWDHQKESIALPPDETKGL